MLPLHAPRNAWQEAGVQIQGLGRTLMEYDQIQKARERQKMLDAERQDDRDRAREMQTFEMARAGWRPTDPTADASEDVSRSALGLGRAIASGGAAPMMPTAQAAGAAGTGIGKAIRDAQPTAEIGGTAFRFNPTQSESFLTKRAESAFARQEQEQELERRTQEITEALVAQGEKPEVAAGRARAIAMGADLSWRGPVTEDGYYEQLRKETSIRGDGQIRVANATRPAGGGGGGAYNWQTIQTADGLVQVDPRTGQTRQIMGPDGQPIQKAAQGGGSAPVWAQKAISGNNSQIATINQAIAALDANPDALGFWRGRADWFDQRWDPEGVPIRASIANIGSLTIKDRSGAAVTAAEFPRLAPFIPSASDAPEAAKQKLLGLRRAIEEENQAIAGMAGAAPAGGSTQEAADARRGSKTWDQRALELSNAGNDEAEIRRILQLEGYTIPPAGRR